MKSNVRFCIYGEDRQTLHLHGILESSLFFSYLYGEFQWMLFYLLFFYDYPLQQKSVILIDLRFVDEVEVPIELLKVKVKS